MRDPYEDRKVITSIRAGIQAFLAAGGPGAAPEVRSWAMVDQEEMAREVASRNQSVVDAVYDAGDAINLAQSALAVSEGLNASVRTMVAGALEGVAQIMGTVKESVLDLEVANEVAQHAVEAYERSVSGEALREMAGANIADAAAAGREALSAAERKAPQEELDAAVTAARESKANAEVSVTYLTDQRRKADTAREDALKRVDQARAVLSVLLKDEKAREEHLEAESILAVAKDLSVGAEDVTEAVSLACQRVEQALASLRMLTAQPGIDSEPYWALVEQCEELTALYQKVLDTMALLEGAAQSK